MKKNNLSKVVIDIETVGKDLSELDSLALESIEREAKRQNYDQESKAMKTSLSPLTGQVVVIGMYNPDTQKGRIYYQNGGKVTDNVNKDGIEYICGEEEEILKAFWEKIQKYNSIITFNGRDFDIPYLMIRSAIHKIKPTRNLLPNRYASIPLHVDLKDQMTFYQGWRGLCSLHFFCKAFGIASPKEGEVTGYNVKEYFKKGEYLKIAEYNLMDLIATAGLYEYWEKYIRN
jgi:3'-5' exonuclease